MRSFSCQRVLLDEATMVACSERCEASAVQVASFIFDLIIGISI